MIIKLELIKLNKIFLSFERLNKLKVLFKNTKVYFQSSSKDLPHINKQLSKMLESKLAINYEVSSVVLSVDKFFLTSTFSPLTF